MLQGAHTKTPKRGQWIMIDKGLVILQYPQTESNVSRRSTQS